MHPEAWFAGTVAASCTADWSNEARAFVRAYEGSRGGAFDAEERALLGASYAYATAYTARLGDRIDPAFGGPASGALERILTHGTSLLTL